MKIVAFAASSSRSSINKQLVTYTAPLTKEIVPGAEVEVIDLNDYEMPLYSIDREKEDGIPPQAQAFRDKIASAGALIISFAEHNGSYAAAYKSLFDWASRIEGKVYEGKPVVLLSTSPGARGGASVLAQARQSMPHFGATELCHLSVPSFFEVFSVEEGRVTDEEVHDHLQTALKSLTSLARN